MNKIIEFSQISELKKYSTDYSRFGEDYIFAHILPDNEVPVNVANASRFNFLTLILCVSGRMNLDINLSSYDVTDNTLIFLGSNDILKTNISERSQVDAYTLFLSSAFLQDINIDISMINPQRFSEERSPIMTLDQDEADLLIRYLELLNLNTTSNADSVYVKSISRNLIASIIYQLMQFKSKRIGEETPSRSHSRRVNYVLDFMKLVHKYHKQERSVGFYAGRLFISPKYLSLIIKESTGKSAAEWIDEYVILEAKNLLRFSGKNIQQIAYELNFTNQSSFGKYFKHITGMSPTEFQRS